MCNANTITIIFYKYLKKIIIRQVIILQIKFSLLSFPQFISPIYQLLDNINSILKWKILFKMNNMCQNNLINNQHKVLFF